MSAIHPTVSPHRKSGLKSYWVRNAQRPKPIDWARYPFTDHHARPYPTRDRPGRAGRRIYYPACHSRCSSSRPISSPNPRTSGRSVRRRWHGEDLVRVSGLLLRYRFRRWRREDVGSGTTGGAGEDTVRVVGTARAGGRARSRGEKVVSSPRASSRRISGCFATAAANSCAAAWRRRVAQREWPKGPDGQCTSWRQPSRSLSGRMPTMRSIASRKAGEVRHLQVARRSSRAFEVERTMMWRDKVASSASARWGCGRPGERVALSASRVSTSGEEGPRYRAATSREVEPRNSGRARPASP